MEGADIYQIAKNCRTSVEMIEKFYAAHIKNTLDAAAINVRRPNSFRQVKPIERIEPVIDELSLKVGDGGNRKGGISWGCLTPPLLHRRSDMPCPKITSS